MFIVIKVESHIIRAILDNVFGAENFQSEIIWSYKRWSNSKKGLMPSHQKYLLLFLVQNILSSIQSIHRTLKTTNIDQILQNRTRDEHNKSVYEIDENGKFKYSKEKKGCPAERCLGNSIFKPKSKRKGRLSHSKNLFCF